MLTDFFKYARFFFEKISVLRKNDIFYFRLYFCFVVFSFYLFLIFISIIFICLISY